MTEHDFEERRATIDRRVFSPAQFVAGIIGVGLIVLGGVALARTGLDALPGEAVTVVEFGHTALMGLIDIVVGLIFLAGAASLHGSRSTLIGLGLATLAFGLIVVIEPSPFAGVLGAGRPLGWLYLAIGAVALIAAWASPVIVTDRSAVTRESDHLP